MKNVFKVWIKISFFFEVVGIFVLGKETVQNSGILYGDEWSRALDLESEGLEVDPHPRETFMDSFGGVSLGKHS